MKKILYLLALALILGGIYLLFFHKQNPFVWAPTQNNQNQSPSQPSDSWNPVPITHQNENNQSQLTVNGQTDLFNTSGPFVRTFDINTIDQYCNPCGERTCFPSEPKMVDLVTRFYTSLREGKSDIAIKMMQENEHLLAYIFPLCSSRHDAISIKKEKWKIVLLTTAGNGFPSVPNDNNYLFGIMTVTPHSIQLIEKNIHSYFDGPLGQKYAKALANGDDTSMVVLLDEIESQTKLEFQRGAFSEPNIQTEYITFMNTP